MYYNLNDYSSAVTEERLASVVCASVKDYLGEVTDYVATFFTPNPQAEQKERSHEAVRVYPDGTLNFARFSCKMFANKQKCYNFARETLL